MAKTTKQIYAWMDKQIKAAQIICTPLNKEDPYDVCIAGCTSNIHIYGIDNLCKLLSIAWNVEDRDSRYEVHYFIYRGYKFFGLVDKEKTDERK